MNVIERIRKTSPIVRAVIYARFSSDNQRDESIDAQIRAIHDYAKKNDIVVVGEYLDKAKSAMTDNRPEFLRMIAEAKNKTFDIVLVHKLDRFARNRQDSIGYRMQLKRHNVSLISVLEYIDDSPESIILESMLEAMAEYYSKNLAREVNKGMKENALKGLHTGGLPPLGYDVDTKTKKLVINEREATAVRLIFDLFIQGLGYDKIVNELNLRGYKTKTGASFARNSIHGIVRNEKYIGTYIFNKTSSRDVDGKRNSHKNKDIEEIVRIEGGVPDIVDKGLFFQVQQKIIDRKRNRSSNRAKEVYLLSGKIICGQCGYTMGGSRKRSGRSKTLHVTYRCIGRKSKHICNNRDIRREYIETYVLYALSECLFDKKLISKIADEYRAFQLEFYSESVNKKDSINKQIIEVTKEINNLITLVSRTGSEMMADKIVDLESEKARLKADYEQICFSTSAKEVSIKELTDSFNKAKGLLKRGELKTTKSLIEQYINKVLIYEDHVEVIFNFHPELNFRQEIKNLYQEGLIHENEKDSLPNFDKTVCNPYVPVRMQVDSVVKARGVEPLSEIMSAKAISGCS